MVLHKQKDNQTERPLKQFHLTVETDLSALKEILFWFEENCREILSETIFFQMEITLIEGFTNTVKYAHLNFPLNTPIELLVSIFDDLIEIKIWDYGSSFDLNFQLQEELNNISIKRLIEQENHRGLLLMNSLTDELYYIRESEEKNCLIMRKNLT